MKSFPKHSEMREVDSSNKVLFGSSMDPHRVEIASYWHEHVLYLDLGDLHKGADELRVVLCIPHSPTR